MHSGALAVSLLVGSIAACSSDSTPAASGGAGGSAGVDGGSVSCASDARALTYVPGMTQQGAGKLMEARLVSITPAPALVGNNRWVIELRDAGGAPIDAASLTVKPLMPLHGHGSSVVPTATPKGQGRYEIDNVVLFQCAWVKPPET